MNKEEKIDFLKNEFNFILNDETFNKLNSWQEFFIEYNSTTNLMSKNDIGVLFEKHVIDSLAVLKWDGFKNKKMILDVGTGGGFPSVILAICFPEKTVIANDSRIKKINFIKEIKQKLNLDNLKIIYSRIEETEPLNADLIVSRAVGKMTEVFELSKKHLNKNGNFLIYKAKTVQEEISDFKKKYPSFECNVIDYKLPLKENFERNLVIV